MKKFILSLLGWTYICTFQTKEIAEEATQYLREENQDAKLFGKALYTK